MRRVSAPAVERILEGLRRYERTIRLFYDRHFAELAAGQTPLALVVTCADSRVVPNLIVASDPGDLFVVRNVANLVPPNGNDADPSAAAAVAYAVEVLDVRDIIVCGHSNCGGMRALLADQPPADPHLRRWLENGRASLEAWRNGKVLDSSLPEPDQLSQTSTLRQLEHLRTYPYVTSREASGELQLHAWWFDIASGMTMAYSPELGRYVRAVEEVERRVGRVPATPRQVA